jgi:hypothetical protein
MIAVNKATRYSCWKTHGHVYLTVVFDVNRFFLYYCDIKNNNNHVDRKKRIPHNNWDDKYQAEIGKEFRLNVIYSTWLLFWKNSSSGIASLIVDVFEIFIAYCTSYWFYRAINKAIERERENKQWRSFVFLVVLTIYIFSFTIYLSVSV